MTIKVSFGTYVFFDVCDSKIIFFFKQLSSEHGIFVHYL